MSLENMIPPYTVNALREFRVRISEQTAAVADIADEAPDLQDKLAKLCLVSSLRQAEESLEQAILRLELYNSWQALEASQGEQH